MNNSHVKIDKEVIDNALDKARQENIPGKMTGLFSYLIKKANKDEIQLNTSDFGWSPNWKTSLNYDIDDVKVFKSKMKEHGIRATISFTINFLFYNYLKQ